MIKWLRPAMMSLLVFCLCTQLAVAAAAEEDEALGQAAEQAGKLREALAHYTSALSSASGEADTRLRERIIQLVTTLDPRPAIPDQAMRSLARAQAAIEMAKTNADFEDAASRLQDALRLAPWWADAYFNLGIVYEKVGRFADAVKSLKWYLRAAPDAKDVEAVRTKIYKLEYAKELTQRQAEREAEEQRAKIAKLSALEGTWRNKETGNPYRVSISGSQFEATSLNGWRIQGVLRGSSIEGTITTPGYREDQFNCAIPSVTEALTGNIEQDGASIVFRSQEALFATQGNRGGLLVPKYCTAVTRTGSQPFVMILVR